MHHYDSKHPAEVLVYETFISLYCHQQTLIMYLHFFRTSAAIILVRILIFLALLSTLIHVSFKSFDPTPQSNIIWRMNVNLIWN